MKFSLGWFSLLEHDEVLGRNGVKTDRPRTFVDESSRLGPHKRTGFPARMKFSEHVLGSIRIGLTNFPVSAKGRTLNFEIWWQFARLDT